MSATGLTKNVTRTTGTAPAVRPFEPMHPEPIQGFPDFGHVVLQKVENTRDLGDLPTQDGKRIAKNRLIRSANPHAATPSDCADLMIDHHLVTIIDFRTKLEIAQSPDPILKLPQVKYLNISPLSDNDVLVADIKDMPHDMRVMKEFADNAVEFMKHLYIKCLTGSKGIEVYATFLQELLKTPEGAVLWHCTQGKDRTGLAAYLVEYILGVSKENRRKDYLATNCFMAGWLENLEEHIRLAHKFKNLDVDMEAYMYASLANLDAGLAAVEKEYGSFDVYIQKALGFGPLQQEQLRKLYLVD